MKKNIVIILLSVVILSLSVYLIFEKMNINNENIEIKEERKNYEMIGDAFSGIETYELPTDDIGKDNTEPKNVVNKIEIPKILIETDVTKRINNEIYKKFEDKIDGIKSNQNSPSRFEQEIIYDYNIKDGIMPSLANIIYIYYSYSGEDCYRESCTSTETIFYSY